MKQYIIFLTILVSTSSGFAQTFTVLKAKGNRAVIQLPRGTTLEKGTSYSISDGDSGSIQGGGGRNGGNGPRTNMLGASGLIFTGSKKASGGSSVSSTTMDLTGLYGWNHVLQEYGALAGISYDSEGSEKTRVISAGGFYDYNLVPNQPGVGVVYGFGGVGEIGLVSSSSGGASSSGNQFTLGGGGQMKWFPFSFPVCFRGDAQLRYIKSKVGVADTTTTGLYLAAGLQTYF